MAPAKHELGKVAKQTLTIEGKPVEVEFRLLRLADVVLDSENPRIQYLLRQNLKSGPPTQQDLAKLIRDGVPNANALFKSIRDNKGLLEPIIVRPDGRVIEGNCRLACYMRLFDIDAKAGNGAHSPWKELPAYVVPHISERQVAAFQGRIHVAGKNPWRAYEKAGHVYAMHHTHGMDPKVIAQILGMSEGEVVRDIRAYETMTQKLFPKMAGPKAIEKWSFFDELYKRKGLEKYRSVPANVDEFVDLVASGKLSQGAHVRDLEKIIKHKPAAKELKKKGIESAMKKLGQTDPTADSKSFRHLEKTIKLIQHFPAKDLARLKESEPRRIFNDLASAIRDVAKTAGVKLQ